MPIKQAIHCVDVTQAHVCPCNTSVTECRVQYKCDGVQSAIQMWRSAECKDCDSRQECSQARKRPQQISGVQQSGLFRNNFPALTQRTLARIYNSAARAAKKTRSHLNKIGSLNNKMDGIVCFLRPAGVGPTIFSTITKPIKVCNTSN